MPARLLLIFLLAATSLAAQSRAWKSADGARTMTGSFVNRNATAVTIRTDAGQQIIIELTKLHPDDVRWLNTNHGLNGPQPDPAAVFDTLLFGDDRETVEKKLKASKIVETTTDETFFGRSGLNGIYFTRQKIGKLKASLFFNWTPENTLSELTLQTDFLPENLYDTELEPTWGALVELLSTLYGKPAQKGPMPEKSSLADGTFMPSHLWNLDGVGVALLGAARDGKKYQLVVRFTQKKIKAVEIP